MKFSVTGVCTRFCRASNGPDLLTRRVLSISVISTLDRFNMLAHKLDMEQHCKWTVCGSDRLGGEGCTCMHPEVASARSWARFPDHWYWFRGIVRNLEGCANGCAVALRSIRV
jgi:hypothetical protein